MNCPSCDVLIFGASCACGWSDASQIKLEVPRTRSTYQLRPPGITKDEFGLDLYEAVKCIGGLIYLRQAQAKTNMHFVKPGQVKDWKVRERQLWKELAALLVRLTEAELADVKHCYPWAA